MSKLLVLLLPLAVLLLGAGHLVGGRDGHVMVIAGTVLAGVATVLVLVAA
jgi:hypothetical protein